ncbi:putative E3 SUMO-protein ligase RNF212 [Genypterus blacodes]|uniref:putative E3 SUMO-protein ligase RNF212 n=1 Tax=Genypterus blacodes TaxID=154954 RepID=UPI003F775064
MSHWICCNSCFHSPTAERKLAVTSCGHVICNVCYQRGKQGACLICNSKCQISPLSANSSSEVKALFSDVSAMATKHFTEISKVITFQKRHQRRLLSQYQQKSEKLEEVLKKMKQEMQQMTKKMNEQSAYIAKLENSLQQRTNVSSASQSSHISNMSVLQIPYNSPVLLSRHSSSSNLGEIMDMDERSLFRKPDTVPRLTLIRPQLDGRAGAVTHRSASQKTTASHSACSASVSRFLGAPLTPDISFGQSSGLASPIFKPLSAFRHSSMSSLVFPPP